MPRLVDHTAAHYDHFEDLFNTDPFYVSVIVGHKHCFRSQFPSSCKMYSLASMVVERQLGAEAACGHRTHPPKGRQQRSHIELVPRLVSLLQTAFLKVLEPHRQQLPNSMRTCRCMRPPHCGTGMTCAVESGALSDIAARIYHQPHSYSGG